MLPLNRPTEIDPVLQLQPRIAHKVGFAGGDQHDIKRQCLCGNQFVKCTPFSLTNGQANRARSRYLTRLQAGTVAFAAAVASATNIWMTQIS